LLAEFARPVPWTAKITSDDPHQASSGVPGGPEDIFIWTTGTGGDADLYVRTGATPTKNIYNQRSALASTSNEAIRIVGNTSGATHFVAVTSYSGAASFALRFSRAKPSNIWSQRVGLAFPATSTQLTTIRSMVKQNMQKFFGASEGQIVISSATITNNIGDSAGNCGNCAGGPCNVCIKATPPPPPPGLAANCAAGLVTLFSTEWNGGTTNPHTLAHEWGHCIVGFIDEYNLHPGCPAHADELCGHSVMANIFLNNYCSSLNHKSDTFPIGHVCSGCSNLGVCTNNCANCQYILGSNWAALASTVNVVETQTPDDANYINHAGFNLLFSVL
jgi:hypothetical protein